MDNLSKIPEQCWFIRLNASWLPSSKQEERSNDSEGYPEFSILIPQRGEPSLATARWYSEFRKRSNLARKTNSLLALLGGGSSKSWQSPVQANQFRATSFFMEPKGPSERKELPTMEESILLRLHSLPQGCYPARRCQTPACISLSCWYH